MQNNADQASEGLSEACELDYQQVICEVEHVTISQECLRSESIQIRGTKKLPKIYYQAYTACEMV